MHKIIILIFSLCLTLMPVSAESITKTIAGLGINKSSVSVSVREVNSGDVVYSLNDKTPRTPASTLKLVTTSAAVNVLGPDFKYSTSLYKSTNNDLYLKLSGDPLLSTSDLGELIDIAKEKNIVPKTFYIDDSAFDGIEWGEGWQWDDDMNPYMPKFSIYNLNNNMLKVEINPTVNNRPAVITVKPFYPISFVNLITTNTKLPTNVKFERNNSIAANMLNATGSVSKLYVVSMPVNNPKMNFFLRLEELMRNKKFEYFTGLKNAKLPSKNVYHVHTIEHSIELLLPEILKNSNNLIAETLFKTAGAKWANGVGSRENSLKMIDKYLSELDINSEEIKIVDGSGVSKNNLMSAEFMTRFLTSRAKDDDFEEFKTMLPAPGEGTLKDRMLYFKTNLNAKTGTLSDTSAIAGYITTKRGKLYAFDIMICDAKTSQTDKKNIEEQILRNIYVNY